MKRLLAILLLTLSTVSVYAQQRMKVIAVTSNNFVVAVTNTTFALWYSLVPR